MFMAYSNQSSFARAMMKANAFMVDGLALIGSDRKEKLELAARQARLAAMRAGQPEEEVAAKQLVQVLKYYERSGLNV